MAIDASIYGQLRQPEPVNPLAELASVQQLQGMQLQNRLAQLGFQDRERALAEAEAQRQAVRGFGADTTANYNRLLQTGNLGAAQGYLKGVQEQQKTGAEVSKTRAEAEAKVFDNYKAQLATVQDPQSAANFVAASYRDPVIGPLLQKHGSLEDGLARLQQQLAKPNGFAEWRAMAAIGIEKLAEMAKVSNVNLGGSMATQSVQPATGAVTQLAAAPVTVSPDALLSADTSRANNAATVDASIENNRRTVGATIRGQDLGDARGRDDLALRRDALNQKGAALAGKPLPTAALKMQQEALDAIGTAGGINADLAAVDAQIAGGKLQLGPVSNLVGTGLNAAGISTENSRNLASFKATLEKLRNDSLRLNKGVQTEGDAQRAWNELIASINDPDLVRQRLGEIQKINERAANLHRMNVDTIRANYGAAPLDTEGRTNLPPAVGGGASAGQSSAPRRVASEADYHALPSGAEYIDPSGTRRRKK